MAKVKHFGRLAFRNSWNNLLLFNDAGLARISLTIYVYQKNSESSFDRQIYLQTYCLIEVSIQL